MFSISALDSISLEFTVTVQRGRHRSVEHAALVGGDHVLNVNECIVSAVHLEQLERLHDEVTEVLAFALTVVDCVTLVQVLGFEQVHDGQNLAVVWHQGFSNGVTARDECLQDVKSSRDDITVTGVQRRCITQTRQFEFMFFPLISARVKHVCMRKEEKIFENRNLLLMGMMSWGMTGRTLA